MYNYNTRTTYSIKVLLDERKYEHHEASLPSHVKVGIRIFIISLVSQSQ